MDVACPAESLVSLGTICRNGEEVSTHRPDDVLVELVQKRVRAAEEPSLFHVAVDHDGRDAVGVELGFLGPAGHLHVAEAVEGE